MNVVDQREVHNVMGVVRGIPPTKLLFEVVTKWLTKQ